MDNSLKSIACKKYLENKLAGNRAGAILSCYAYGELGN